MFKKFKSENAFVGTDITVAIIIILLLMSLISILFFNIQKASKGIERKSEATYLATRIIEEIKNQNYDNITLTGKENNVEIWKDISEYKYSDSSGIINTDSESDIEIESGYTCEVNIQNYVSSNRVEENASDLVKIIKVRVKYKVGGEVKEIELETSIVRN